MTRSQWIAAASCLLFPVPSFAQDETETPSASPSPSPEATPATVDVQEEAARDLAAEIDALRADLERRGKLRIGGVASGAAVFPDDRTAQFTIPRAGVFAFAPLGERISFSGEVTILGGGAEQIDADYGVPGRGDVFLQNASTDLILVPDLLIARGGLIAVPMGRDNLVPDESAHELFIRAGESLYIIPTPWSDAGAGFLGGILLGPVRLEYQAYVLSGPSNGIDAFTGLRNARQLPGLDRNKDKALSARLTVAPVEGVEIGLSGYSGAYSEGGGRRLGMAAVDVVVDEDALLFEAQGVYARTDGGTGATGLPIPESLYGGSARVTWRFMPRRLSVRLPSELQSSTFGASLRYSLVDTDGEKEDLLDSSANPNSFTRRDRLGLGLSYRPVDRYILRVEYEIRSEGGGSFVDDDRAVLSATAGF